MHRAARDGFTVHLSSSAAEDVDAVDAAGGASPISAAGSDNTSKPKAGAHNWGVEEDATVIKPKDAEQASA